MFQEIKNLVAHSYIKENEPMKNHTTFQTGGPADIFVQPQNEEQVGKVIQYCRERKIPYFILGNGSDLLVSDKGYRGVMISLSDICKIQMISKDILEAEAGALLSDVAKYSYQKELTGMEFASGIPGTVGGAVFMNAGAYGGEIKDILLEAKIMERDGKIHWVLPEDLELGYRQSNISKLERTVIAVRLQLAWGEKEKIRARMEELATQRREKQPLEYPSAGSTFKRPEGYFVGKLVDEAGLRGYRVGGAMVSEKHCGFVINVDHATSSEIYQLIQEIQKIIKEKFGVELHTEVRLIGEFE